MYCKNKIEKDITVLCRSTKDHRLHALSYVCRRIARRWMFGRCPARWQRAPSCPSSTPDGRPTVG